MIERTRPMRAPRACVTVVLGCSAADLRRRFGARLHAYLPRARVREKQAKGQLALQHPKLDRLGPEGCQELAFELDLPLVGVSTAIARFEGRV